MIANMFSVIFYPKKQWQTVADRQSFPLIGAIFYTALLACIPAIAWFYGTTNVGWVIGDGEVIKLTEKSAKVLIGLFYLTMVASICAIGFMIHWMSKTYGTDSSTAKGIAVAGISATPLFLAGTIGFVPVYGFDLLIGVAALSYAVYLLYLGMPIVMRIPEERGFLFSSAVIAFCMVILMVIMGGSVILWDLGAAPDFTD